MGGAGGGIAGMPDGHRADQVVQNLPVKDLRDQAHAFMGAELPAIRADNAGAFLPAVLQDIKAVIGQFRGVWMAKNAKDTTVMFRIFLHGSRSLTTDGKSYGSQEIWSSQPRSYLKSTGRNSSPVYSPLPASAPVVFAK